MKSPSETIRAEILSKDGQLVYSVQFNDQTIIDEASMGIVVDGVDYSKSRIEPDHVRTETVDQTYPILGVTSTARNHYNGTTVPLTTKGVNGKWVLEARAYDDGFAFRYVLPGKGQRTIEKETTSFNFPDGSRIWYFERDNAWKLKSYAGEWISAPISRMPKISKMGPIQGLPLVVELPQKGYAVLTEAACWNYSGMRCEAVGNNTFVAALADPSFKPRNEIVTPWRVVLCAEDLNTMVNSTLVSNLAPEPDSTLYADTGYIKPGRSVWRWWSSGTGSPEQEKDYIDYAVALGYEYTTIDDGWKDWPDAWRKLAELCDYAQEKKIGVFVWKHSKEINDPSSDWENMRTFFDKVKATGAVGMKIDFMNAESKATIDFEIAALKLAAQQKLLINFHGCHKSTGEARSYPNEITREGIRGLELNKMKEGPISASHNAALPFTRFLVGHADYTPLTVTPEKLGPTTISHQLATVVCFTTPLQTISENPGVLFQPKFNDLVSVLKQIPSVWDETRVLPGSKIGDLAVMARRKGDVWFIAAINGAEGRQYALNLSFINDRKYSATIIRDHADSPSQFKAEEQPVNRLTTMNLDMHEGGGYVILLHPNNAGGKKMDQKLLPAPGHTKISAYETLTLWNGPAPGTGADLEPERNLPEGRVSHVSIPTLDVYHPEKPNGTVLLICSGGGYKKLASGPIGLGAADEFLKDGYTVCSLKYRLSPPSVDVVRDACMDGARALRFIRSHATDWNIDPKRVGMIGFSAGANLILNLACQNDTGDSEAADPVERLSARPDFMVLASLWLHNQKKLSDWAVHPQLPPCLIVHARDDRVAPIDGTEVIARALRKKRVPVELEIYEQGGHMAFNFPSPTATGWPQQLRDWLHKQTLK